MIITATQLRTVRPIAENVSDPRRIDTYINEAEELLILPIIGAELYSQLQDIDPLLLPIVISDNFGNDFTLTPEVYDLLYNGGYFIGTECSCDDPKKEYCGGLVKASGYLTYARMIKNQQVNITAFGVRQKEGQFSSSIDEKTLIRVSNEAQQIGLEYLRQCVAYCESIKLIKSNKLSPKYTRRIKSIGL